MRRVISVLVVVGLALAVVLLWANRGGDSSPGTQAQATTTTLPATTTTLPPETTTLAATTTTSPTEVEIVETVEQAEAILRELWFGWFEGIYNEDEDRIREVVATEQMLAAGINAFGALEFTSSPVASQIEFLEKELLLSTPTCLAIWSTTTTSFLDQVEPRSGVDIIRDVGGAWRFASSWRFRDDLWETDCESELLPLPPQ